MKYIIFIVLASLSIAISAKEHSHQQAPQVINSVQYSCPMHPSITGDHKDACTICGMFLSTPITPVEKANNNTYQCPMHPTITGDIKDRCSICNMFLTDEYTPVKDKSHDDSHQHDHSSHAEDSTSLFEQKTPAYICPMHADIIGGKSDRCPICGMNLELKKTKVNPASIAISGHIMQTLGIKTQQVKRRTLSKKISTFGKVTYDESSKHTVYPRIEGWIKRTTFKYTGEVINKGDVLFYIYSPELLQAQEDYILSLSSSYADLSKGTLKRLILLGFTMEEIETLKSTRKSKVNVPIIAEQKGVITKINITNGSYVSRDNALIETVDLSSTWVIASVFPKDEQWLTTTSSAHISSESGISINSSIDFIHPELNAQTQTLHVRFVVNDSRFKPNDFVNVIIEGKTLSDTLFIPTSALIQTKNNNRVVVRNTDNTFSVNQVTISHFTDEYVAVTKGLSEGDVIVTSGQFLIDSEASIQGNINRIGTLNVH
jgi:Cu(I)/Ag(I) efflux system membrane fusion protein